MFTEQWSDLSLSIILVINLVLHHILTLHLDLILISILTWCAADLVGESRVTQGPSQAPKPHWERHKLYFSHVSFTLLSVADSQPDVGAKVVLVVASCDQESPVDHHPTGSKW